jgi:hypothetical protein
MRASLICWFALFAPVAAVPALGITLGQLDDFQDGTVEFWGGGGGSGSPPPTNIPSGGPEGFGDRYLQIAALNSHLGTNNATQWTGDYLAAGVGKIRFLLNNTGTNPLAMRITVFGPGGTFTTTNETVVDPGIGWVVVDFGLDSESLTQTAGFGTLAATLADVSTLLIRHDPDPISSSGQGNPVTGQLGIDNIRALPEPGVLAQLGVGFLALRLAQRSGSRRAR